MKTEIMTKIAT